MAKETVSSTGEGTPNGIDSAAARGETVRPQEDPSGSNRRRTLLIKRDFQIRIVLIVLLTVVIFANINAIIMYSLFTRSMGTGALLDYMGIADPSDAFVFVILITESLGLVVVFAISLYISNSLAGPIYNIEKVLVEVAEGNLSKKVKLRSGDEFHELAIEVNNAIEGIRERIEIISETARTLPDAMEKGPPGQAVETAQRLCREIDSFKF